jgi:hypothetical protein
MNTIQQFSCRAKNIDDVPSPFREVLTQRIEPEESIRHLIFSPQFSTGRFRTSASLFCVMDRRWMMFLGEDEACTKVAEASFEETSLVELTIILLYGQLKIDFYKEGKAQSAMLNFNTVMDYIYLEAIRDILDEIDGIENASLDPERKGNPLIRDWPLKFKNAAVTYIPRGSKLMDGVDWNTIFGSFRRELAPAGALLLTNRHLMFISEDKSSSWLRSRGSAKYGKIINFFPLKRLAKLEIVSHARFNVLELKGRDIHRGEKLGIFFPLDKRDSVDRVVAKAVRPL